MESQKYKLCLQVLKRLEKEKILEETLLVGSWCIYLYKDYFDNKAFLPPLRTRDIDFLFPIPFKLKTTIDLFELLKDLGFVLDFKGEQGHIKFMHPDLILEFLVPARGKSGSKPFPIKQLGINAQALRFMDVLFRSPIQVFFDDVMVNTPHPADFALHKLLISERRTKSEKASKDVSQAVAVLKALRDYRKSECIIESFSKMPKKWQKTIFSKIKELGEENLIADIG